MRCSRLPRPSWAALVVLIAALSGASAARAAEPVTLPKASGLVLDGRLSEPAWETAARIPVSPVAVPARRGEEPPGGTTREIRPEDVRLLVADGQLWIGVEIREDVGLGTGVKGMLAWPDTASAADAFSFAFLPQDVRNLRYVARGPRGVGRGVYRVRGALDLSDAAVSRIEVAIPLADLAPPAPDAVLRAAFAVNTRTPEAIGWAPASAKLAPPSAWASFRPPEGGWSGEASVDAAAIAAEDAKDTERMAALRKFLEGRLKPPPPGSPGEVFSYVKTNLLDPLDAVLAARPDLAFARVVKADVYRQLGKTPEAAAEAREALRVVPGLREARFLLLETFAGEESAGKPEEPSDYTAALAKLDAAGAEMKDPYDRDGVDFARGLLLFKQGEFEKAAALLGPVAERYPFSPRAVETAEQARRYADLWAAERQYRAGDDKRGDLPRARIQVRHGETTGAIVVELYEEDAPNTVRNFVWLAEKGFYDGSTFHRNVPFFVLQGGDPLSRDPDPARARLAGAGGPCYAIRTEPSKRKPFRGAIAMARSPRRDTEGSQFFLITGTAFHLEGEYSVFGRIVEGQEVAERLVRGAVIEKVEVLRKRPGATYRPMTTAGQPAPEPKPCGPK